MDEKNVDIRPYLEGASSHIERALRAGRNVLVHCQQVSMRWIGLAVLGMLFRASSWKVWPFLSLVDLCLGVCRSSPKSASFPPSSFFLSPTPRPCR